MIYLVGGVSHERHVERIAAHPDLGLMIVPSNQEKYSQWLDGRVKWGGDNGVFSTSGHGFKEKKFMAMLENPRLQAAVDDCLFVAAPDSLTVTLPDDVVRRGNEKRRSIQRAEVMGDAAKTLELFDTWGPVVRDHGFPVALVAQDGLVDLLDQVPWKYLDVVFVGGSDNLKRGEAGRLIVEAAVAHGKFVHMGRVNSLSRMRKAWEWGCGSSDGTAITYAPDRNIEMIVDWMSSMTNKKQEMRFDFEEEE